jgi:hypothetical protein
VSGILLCLAALLLLVGALYLLLCHEPIVARWFYRVFPSQAFYPPEAAEAPDEVEQAYVQNGDTLGFPVPSEPFTSAAGVPVVPGDWTAELLEAYDRYRRGEDVYAGARREPSPEVQR